VDGFRYQRSVKNPRIDERLTGREIERAYVDKGYRGHGAPNPHRVFISGLTHARMFRVRSKTPYPFGPPDVFAMAVWVVARAA